MSNDTIYGLAAVLILREFVGFAFWYIKTLRDKRNGHNDGAIRIAISDLGGEVRVVKAAVIGMNGQGGLTSEVRQLRLDVKEVSERVSVMEGRL